jgi:hypothetical protein
VHQYSKPGDENQDEERWIRVGDGYLLGLRQRVAPGLTYATCSSKTDFDYTDERSGRMTRSNKGWEFKPAAWLTLVWETERSRFSWSGESVEGVENPESRDFIRHLNGIEINLGGIARLRYGSIDGDPSWGLEWTLPNLKLMYAEATDYLDDVIESEVERMRNVHFYGFELYIP